MAKIPLLRCAVDCTVRGGGELCKREYIFEIYEKDWLIFYFLFLLTPNGTSGFRSKMYWIFLLDVPQKGATFLIKCSFHQCYDTF